MPTSREISEILIRVNAELVDKQLGQFAREIRDEIQDEETEELTYHFDQDDEYAN